MCFSLMLENDLVMNNQTAPSDGISTNGMSEEEMRKQRKLDQKKRHGIVLWRRPIVTLTYFCFEMGILLHDYKERYMYCTCYVQTSFSFFSYQWFKKLS